MNKNNLPDLVAVVRCKDCIYHQVYTNWGFKKCHAWGVVLDVEKNDFCSRGISKEEEDSE